MNLYPSKHGLQIMLDAAEAGNPEASYHLIRSTVKYLAAGEPLPEALNSYIITCFNTILSMREEQPRSYRNEGANKAFNLVQRPGAVNKEFVAKIRADRVNELMKETGLSVEDAAYQVACDMYDYEHQNPAYTGNRVSPETIARNYRDHFGKSRTNLRG